MWPYRNWVRSMCGATLVCVASISDRGFQSELCSGCSESVNAVHYIRCELRTETTGHSSGKDANIHVIPPLSQCFCLLAVF